MTREHRTYGDRRKWQTPAGYGFKVDQPVPGFYRLKMGADTVTRAVQIVYGPPNDPVTGEVLDRSWRWMAVLDDGQLCEFERAWPACARRPITEEEYQRCCARTAWARKYAPDSAYAKVGRKLDPLSLDNPLPF